MATRSRTSSQKRQKELLRMERQKEKAAKRLARKLNKKEGDGPEIEELTPLEPLDETQDPGVTAV